MTPNDHAPPQIQPRGFGPQNNIAAIFILLLVFGPSIAIMFAACASLVKMVRHKAWCMWTPVLAGLLLGIGDITYRFKPWGHGTDFLALGMIDMAAFCLMQASFIAFARLVYSMQPSGSDDRIIRMSCCLRGGYALLWFSGLAIIFLLWLRQRYYALVLTLPFCVYFVGLHFISKRQIAEWASLEEPLSLDPNNERPWTDLFNATWWISAILIARSVYGIWAAYRGESNSAGLFYLITGPVLPALVHFTFNRYHPGWYIPRKFTVLLYHDEKATYKPVSGQIPLEAL